MSTKLTKRLVCLFFILIPSLCFASLYAQTNAIPVDANASRNIVFGMGSVPTQVFHAQIEADGNAPGPGGYSELFHPPIQQGVTGTEVSVGLKAPKKAGRIFVTNGDSIRTGVAFSNPNARDVVLSFYFTDINGIDFGAGTTTIHANGQISRFLSEAPFNGPPDFTGTFTFSASDAVGALALRGLVNETGLFLMPQIPVVEIGSTTSGTTVVPYFAHGAVSSENCSGSPEFITPFGTCAFSGGAIRTELILVNPTDQTLQGTFQFLGQGTPTSPAPPIEVTMGRPTSSTFAYVIPPRSVRGTGITSLGMPVDQGSIQISPNGTAAPFAFAILTFVYMGTTQYQTTVPGQAPSRSFRILLRDFLCCGATPTYQTSTTVAITNPSSTPVLIGLTFLSDNRSPLVMLVPARGQLLVGPNAMQVGSGYGGLLRVTSDSPISIVGFQRFVFRSQFGSLAVEAFDESLPSTGQQLAPQLAVGNYESSLIVFKTADTQSSSAVIRFFTQEGLPADPKDFGLQP